MSIYVQDETVPIYICLQYAKNFLKFPLNPDELSVDIPSDSRSENIEGIGEIAIPSKPKLASFSIKSFFWQARNTIPSFQYVNWIKAWQKSEKPAQLVVTRFNYSMKVTCEKFKHTLKAGEEKDIYFELELKEYRNYGAKFIRSVKNNTLKEQFSEFLGQTKTASELSPPVLIEIPIPNRDKINKAVAESTFKVRKGVNTLCSIAKNITGDSGNWEDFYLENKNELADIIGENKEIPLGTEIRVPSVYVNNADIAHSNEVL